jgi:hypothetical protein
MLRWLTRHVLALFAFAALAGCQQESISTYRVPHVAKSPPRLLGAIAPAGESVWFLKLTGAAPEVATHEREFEQFVRSLRFTDDSKSPISWALPDGWREAAAPAKGGMAEQTRFATFFVGAEGLKLTISRLPKFAGDILPNVNRWRKNDLNLKPITEADLAGVTHTVTVNDHPITLVDMTGSTAPITEEEPNEPAAPPAGGPTGPLEYDVPAGWQPLPATGMRVAAFKVTDGNQSAEVTVIPLGGVAGGLVPNVNRWRKEVGLPDTTDADLRKEAKMLDSPAGSVVSVDLAGPKERTLGGILMHRGQSWFVKLRGPADLVGKQQSAFEAFVKSLRFGAK